MLDSDKLKRDINELLEFVKSALRDAGYKDMPSGIKNKMVDIESDLRNGGL